MSEIIGRPHVRVEGRLKVTGQAKYAGDFVEPKLAHAVIFGSTIPSGTIRRFDLTEARAVEGVIEILTFENAPKLKKPKNGMFAGSGEKFLPLQDAKVFYNGQHIGAVIAESLEAANEAARRVKVMYAPTAANLTFDANAGHKAKPQQMQPLSKKRGEGASALAKSEVLIDETYVMPIENHNPMEPSATFASIKGDSILVYDATQAVFSAGEEYAKILDLKEKNVQTITKFVGGGFGCKGSFWPHQAIAAMATRKTGRPIKLVLTREQMFTGVGHRARVTQKIAIGARKTGELVVIKHEATNATAVNKDFCENTAAATPMLYACPNIETIQKVLPLNYQAPTYMRAPGHSSGSFALESAMDELAVKLKMDPIELRMRNYTDVDPELEKPFTSKSLKTCYEQGAEKFGWKNRATEPKTKSDGDWWIGHGMATATYPANRFTAKAKVELKADGKARVTSATQDIGTGTYTIMKQIAAEKLGLKYDDVDFDLGDNKFPEAAVSGGSSTASSVGSAIVEACENLKKDLFKLAAKEFGDAKDLIVDEGMVYSKAAPAKKQTVASILAKNGSKALEGEGSIGMFTMIKGMKFGNSKHAFGAQFAEVRVHKRTGEIRVNKITGAFAAGKILNPLTARSQFEGGIVMGVGMALLEETVPDTRNGRFVVKDLADYHVPVQADIPNLDIIMVDEKDTEINALGAKGIGEIGITGVAAAIANAVYNATGVRLRELPMTPSKMIAALS